MNADHHLVDRIKTPIRQVVHEGCAKYCHDGRSRHVEREVYAEIDACPG